VNQIKNQSIQVSVVPALSNEIMNQEICATFLPVAYAIPSEAVRTPFLPVARFIDDCFGIVGHAREQLSMLKKVGVEASHVDVLEHRLAGLKVVQQMWNKERSMGLGSSMETTLVQAETVRHEALGFCRAALAKHPVFGQRLASLEMNDGVHGLIDDLGLLNELFVDAKHVFGSLQIDVSALSTKLSTTVEALEKGVKGKDITASMLQTMELRNRMYTLVMDSIFGITDCAYAVFGAERTHKAQWMPYACMGEYGWSI
jgi:hypothetical protein